MPDATLAPAPEEVRSSKAIWIRGTLLGGLVLALTLVGWTWRHPAVFHDAGGWGVGSKTWDVNAPFYVGMSYEKPDAEGTITIHSVHAVDLSAADDAVVEFFVCTVDPKGGSSAIGSASEASIRGECSSLVPAAGATLELNAHPRQQLLVAVTLPHPGRVKLAGLDVSYSHGWQRGTQRIGGDVELRAVAKRD